MGNDNAKMAVYMTARYHRRRANIVAQLGGMCVKCGKDDSLQIDHINPLEKSFDIGKRLSSIAEEKLKPEVAKCQLLCGSCHIAKTLADNGQSRAKHGTRGMYVNHKCRCVDCVKASSDYNVALKRSKRQSLVA